MDVKGGSFLIGFFGTLLVSWQVYYVGPRQEFLQAVSACVGERMPTEIVVRTCVSTARAAVP